MAFEDVYRVGDKLDVVAGAEVDAVATRLGTRFPDGYREFVTTLGVGDYTNYVRVYLPSQVVEEMELPDEVQPLWRTHPAETIERGGDVLPLDRLRTAIVLSSTVDGDSVVFLPDNPDAIYMIDVNSDSIDHIGSNLYQSLDWLTHHSQQNEILRVRDVSGAFVERDVRYFEPYGDRGDIRFGLQETAATSVRHYLLSVTQEDPADVICLSHRYQDDDGIEREWLQLLVQEFQGYVAAYFHSEAQGGVEVVVTYDIDHQTDKLMRLLAYVDTIATSRGDMTQDPGMPTWDRNTRTWSER